MMAAALSMAACEKQDEPTEALETGRLTITFNAQHWENGEMVNFDSGTRALTSDGKPLTDLWVIDYVDGVWAQTLHQSSDDEDFGAPRLSLDYGSHNIYFVASRGSGPVLSTEDHSIVWEKTSDSFWTVLPLTVSSATATSQAVTLQRVVTMLKVSVNDEVPDGLAKVTVTPAHWYYGLDYLTGFGISDQTLQRQVNIPASYAGTTGRLNIDIFGFVPSGGFTSDVSITATDGSEAVVGAAAAGSVTFAANHTTVLSGALFSGGGLMDVSVNDAWGEDITATW